MKKIAKSQPFPLLILGVLLILMYGCKKEEEIIVTDIDGNVYKTVTIGGQLWMAENLKTTKYNDGTTVPLVTDSDEWINLTTSAYCWFENDEATNKVTYGALYNWFVLDAAANGGKNVCPVGWHVPSDAEFKQLEMNLGINQSDVDKTEWRGTDEGGKLKESGLTHWNSPNTGATNSSGFTALPGGYRGGSGSFVGQGIYGIFWTSTESENDITYAWRRTLGSEKSEIYHFIFPKTHGLSVRCIMDN